MFDGAVAGTVAVGKAVVPTTGKTVDEINVTLLKVGIVDKSNVLIGAAAFPQYGSGFLLDL